MKRTCTEVWENCLKIIKDNIHYQSYKTWFLPINPIKLENNVLTIQVPSQFFYEWLEEHYVGLLKKTIKKELGADGRLEYSILMETSYDNPDPLSIKMPATNRKALATTIAQDFFNFIFGHASAVWTVAAHSIVGVRH